MKRGPKKRTTVASLVVALIGFLIWQFTPAQAVIAIANLSDPAKLATLGERGANSRLNKIVYWLDDARRKGMALETTLGLAQFLTSVKEPRASLVRESLTRNLRIADELGLFNESNRDLLRRGNAATVTRGPYAGQLVDIDHIVPFSLAPEAGNELANLEMLPKTLNLQKSNRIGERQLAHAGKLFAAGLLTKESFARVKSSAS